MMKKLYKTLLVVALAAVLIVGGIIVGFNLKSQKAAVIEGVFEQRKEVTADISSATIKTSLDGIAELAVEEYNFTNVGTYEEASLKVFGIDIPFTEKSIILTYDGSVKAGIRDFDRIKIQINDAKKTIMIKVPAVEVLDTFIDANSIEVYDQTQYIFNPVDADDVPRLLAAEQENAQKLAVENGLLEKAEKRLQDILSAHLHTLLADTQCADYEIKLDLLP